MKKLFLSNILGVLCSVLIAQDITITFKSKSDTLSIDSISAINLRTNQMVKLLGGESLLLVKTSTDINQIKGNLETGYIYPNPTDGEATFYFSMNKRELVEIRLHNANGQLLQREKQSLSPGTHRFLLRFPLAGMYYISLVKNEETTCYKAIYTGRKTQNSSILYDGADNFNLIVSDENKVKNATTDKSLVYTEGDVIQYLFFSGINTTIVSDIPSDSKTIDAEFISCIDNDGKSYKVLKIGDQWWMAENLAYLPKVHPLSFTSHTEPYFYVYGYDGSEIAAAKQNENYVKYGVLYNWIGAKVACPLGWHLPTDLEWKQLEIELGMNPLQVESKNWRGINEGKVMKTTIGWSNNGNGSNVSGFSALPSGFRTNEGFYEIELSTFWWSATESYPDVVWTRVLDYFLNKIGRYEREEASFGFCVRCVKD